MINKRGAPLMMNNSLTISIGVTALGGAVDDSLVKDKTVVLV